MVHWDFLPVVDQPVKRRKSECPPSRQKEEINDSCLEADHSMRKKASSIERVVDIEKSMDKKKTNKTGRKVSEDLSYYSNTTSIKETGKRNNNGTTHEHTGLNVPDYKCTRRKSETSPYQNRENQTTVETLEWSKKSEGNIEGAEVVKKGGDKEIDTLLVGKTK